MNAVVIIQARLGSKRLPAKVLAPLNGKPVIAHVIESVQRAHPVQIIVATTNLPEDEPLRCFLECSYSTLDNIYYDAGSSDDVLGRFYNAHLKLVEDKNLPVCRVTGDCPLIDHRTMLWLVDEFSKRDVPYLGLTNAPDGDDFEAFSFAALKEAQERAKNDRVLREHVTPYMRQMPGALTWRRPEGEEDVKYSVDDIDDLHVCEALLGECGPGATCHEYVKAYRRLYPQ